MSGRSKGFMVRSLDGISVLVPRPPSSRHALLVVNSPASSPKYYFRPQISQRYGQKAV